MGPMGTESWVQIMRSWSTNPKNMESEGAGHIYRCELLKRYALLQGLSHSGHRKSTMSTMQGSLADLNSHPKCVSRMVVSASAEVLTLRCFPVLAPQYIVTATYSQFHPPLVLNAPKCPPLSAVRTLYKFSRVLPMYSTGTTVFCP